jgi:hypothetical protein
MWKYINVIKPGAPHAPEYHAQNQGELLEENHYGQRNLVKEQSKTSKEMSKIDMFLNKSSFLDSCYKGLILSPLRGSSQRTVWWKGASSTESRITTTHKPRIKSTLCLKRT